MSVKKVFIAAEDEFVKNMQVVLHIYLLLMHALTKIYLNALTWWTIEIMIALFLDGLIWFFIDRVKNYLLYC